MAAVTELRRAWPEFRRRLRRTLRRLVLVVRQPSTVRLNGVELELGPWATAPVRRAIYQGWYERNEHDVLLATLRPEDTVLELGCGAGYITTVAARIAREVRAFDGNPDIVAVARDTVTHNGCVATVENAVIQRRPERGDSALLPRARFPRVEPETLSQRPCSRRAHLRFHHRLPSLHVPRGGHRRRRS